MGFLISRSLIWQLRYLNQPLHIQNDCQIFFSKQKTSLSSGKYIHLHRLNSAYKETDHFTLYNNWSSTLWKKKYSHIFFLPKKYPSMNLITLYTKIMPYFCKKTNSRNREISGTVQWEKKAIPWCWSISLLLYAGSVYCTDKRMLSSAGVSHLDANQMFFADKKKPRHECD